MRRLPERLLPTWASVADRSLFSIVVGESDTLDEAQRLPMRHSRSMPSVPTADWAGLATPRNLIEVSARLRSSQELDAQRSSEPLHRSG